MPNVNRHVWVGQNTPLTCVFMTGYEFGDTARDKIQSVNGTVTYQTSTPSPHQNSGYGGAQYRRFATAGAYDLYLGVPTLREFVICKAEYLTTNSVATTDMMDSSSASLQFRCQSTQSTGVLALIRNTTTLVSSSAGVIPGNQWNWLHCWVFVDNTTGFAHARIGSWGNLVATVTGADTQQHATNNFADQARIGALTTSPLVTYSDDLMIFARSIYFSGGSGTLPSSGATLTGSTSGATCLIQQIYSDGSGKGCYFIHTVTGTFQAGETITSGGWSGTSGNALGNDQASLWVPEQYIFLGTLTSDIAAGFTSSTGASHYTEVDDAATITDYVSTNTNGQVDEYDVNVVLPPGADISAVDISAYARLNGVSAVSAIRCGFNDGSTPVDNSANSPLSGAWESHECIASYNPNTGAKFTTTEIGNLTARITSKT